MIEEVEGACLAWPTPLMILPSYGPAARQLDTRKTCPFGANFDSLRPWRWRHEPREPFSLSGHLERLNKDGDPLEVLDRTADFEFFRRWPVEGTGYSDGPKGGRPPFDPVAMFKLLTVQAQRNLGDGSRMEFMIRKKLSWIRLFGFDPGGCRMRTPFAIFAIA